MKLEEKILHIKSRLQSKSIMYPVNIVAAVVSLIFAIIVLNVIPHQIEISKTEIVNGSSFPILLMYIVILCSISILAVEIKKIIKKERIVYKPLNLFVEMKALFILMLFVGFYLINVFTNMFIIGACFFSIGFLIFSKCKKKHYYVIVVVSSLLIWLLFRFLLNVKL